MKIEQKMIATVHDQTGILPSEDEVFQCGPEIAWAEDKQTAQRFAERQKCPTHVMDTFAAFVVADDGRWLRLCEVKPLDADYEREAARERVLAKLTPEERALLEEP